jgi:hypothetical protein
MPLSPDVLALLLPLWPLHLNLPQVRTLLRVEIGAEPALAGVTTHEEAIARIEEALRAKSPVMAAMADPWRLPASPPP